MVNGAGRTDAGVHALGQVASFRTQSGLSAAEFQRALNALLPSAIRIVGAEEVGPDFHARWSALGKIYRYRLYRGKVVPPAVWRYVLHYPFPLDEDAMRIAASRFVGPHDFAAFAASTGSEDDDKERSTVREIYASELASQRRRRRARLHRAWPVVHALHGSQNGWHAARCWPRQTRARRYSAPLSTTRSLQVGPDRATAGPLHGASDAR